MGYRHYFAKAPLVAVNNVRDFSVEQLKEYARGIGAYDSDNEYVEFLDDTFLWQERIYELGKLYWDDTADRIYKTGNPLFSNAETQDLFSDYLPYVVGEEGVVEAIKIYSEKTLKWYKDLLEDGKTYEVPFGLTIRDEGVERRTKIASFINDRIRQWERGVVNIKTEYDAVTGSWDYEYAVFQLSHLLHTIDWDKYTVLFYGY